MRYEFDIQTGEVQEYPDAAPILLSSEETIKQQITLLEAQVTQRRLREALLGVDSGWLKDINNQISTLRTQL